MASKKILTVERLREVLRYDPKTGEFAWIEPKNGRRAKVGCVQFENGRPRYIKIEVDAKKCRAHILAWMLMTGARPVRLIDHINQDPTDNRWVNLRLGTKRLNSLNHRLYANNKSGATGVHWCNTRRKWIAKTHRRYLGQFDTKDEAIQIAQLHRTATGWIED